MVHPAYFAQQAGQRYSRVALDNSPAHPKHVELQFDHAAKGGDNPWTFIVGPTVSYRDPFAHEMRHCNMSIRLG